MNTIDRNRLLMEMAGINCVNEAEALSNALRNSPLYIDSKIRLSQAALSNFPSALKDYASLRDLDFAVTTLADYASLEAHILTYAIHSFPAWWTNPFEVDKGKDSPLSIGALLVDKKGKIVPIDNMIQDDALSLEEKFSIIEERIDGWHKDQSQRFLNAIEEAKLAKNASPFVRALTDFFSMVLLLLGNLFVLYTFSNELLRPFFNEPDGTYLSTYAVYLPLSSMILYDILFTITKITNTRRYQGYDYVMNFSRKRLGKVLSSLNKKTVDITKYLKGHIRNKAPCDKDSMTYFILDESKYVKGILALNRKPRHWILEAFFMGICWLLAFVLIFSLAIVIINIQRGIAI